MATEMIGIGMPIKPSRLLFPLPPPFMACTSPSICSWRAGPQTLAALNPASTSLYGTTCDGSAEPALRYHAEHKARQSFASTKQNATFDPMPLHITSEGDIVATCWARGRCIRTHTHITLFPVLFCWCRCVAFLGLVRMGRCSTVMRWEPLTQRRLFLRTRHQDTRGAYRRPRLARHFQGIHASFGARSGT